MARLNLSELNTFINNFFDKVGVRDLTAIHAERIKQWLIENLSKIGRYATRDFERFGTLESHGQSKNDGRKFHMDRADGWVSLTEEVPDLDHFTYGTGVLWIHGEFELPAWWEGLGKGRKMGDHIYGDEYAQTTFDGKQKHLFQRTTGETYTFWYEPTTKSGSPAGGTNWGDQGWEYGYLWHDTPDVTAQINQGTKVPKDGVAASESDEIAWFMETITYNTGSDIVKEKADPSVVPDTENDKDLYHLDNERNHYPYRIIHSTSPKSVKWLLENVIVAGGNGMYDNTIPAIATSVGTWPPASGHSFAKQGINGIVNFISPIEEVPTSGRE